MLENKCSERREWQKNRIEEFQKHKCAKILTKQIMGEQKKKKRDIKIINTTLSDQQPFLTKRENSLEVPL